jgi:hypothetical protein
MVFGHALSLLLPLVNGLYGLNSPPVSHREIQKTIEKIDFEFRNMKTNSMQLGLLFRSSPSDEGNADAGFRGHHRFSNLEVFMHRLLRNLCLTVWLLCSLLGQSQDAQRPEFEAIADRLIRSDNPYLGTAQVEEARARPDGDPPAPERVEALAELALELIRIGDNHEAADRID